MAKERVIHLIIGDSHAKPGVPNDRFSWLGNMIVDISKKHPEHVIKVIDLGDFADMPSLSSYDVGKKSFEGKRYKQDVSWAIDARRKLTTPIINYRLSKKQSKQRLPKIELYALGGNHDEGRIKKTIELTAILDGTISHLDFQTEKFGWKYTPFLQPLFLDGFCYQHYFTSGVMGRPIGGEHPAYSLLVKQYDSCVQGHSHMFDIAHRTKPNGKRVWGIHAGCYLDPEQHEDYAGPANKLWMRGILILYDVQDGDFNSFSWLNVNDIKAKYGVQVA